MQSISPSCHFVAPIKLSREETESPDHFQSRIYKIFQQLIGIRDERFFKVVWKHARVDWKKNQPLNDEAFHKITAALKNTLIYLGRGIQTQGSGPDPEIHDIVQFLISTGKTSKDWINKKNLKGILIKQDPELLRSMREELQIALKSCSSHLPEAGSGRETLFHGFVGHLISLLPFASPEIGEKYSIPVKVGGSWKTVEYTVDRKIEMSPKWLSTPMHAYGFVSPEGPPLLSFIGSTYPAGDGYAATHFADYTPGMSVGHAPYLYGKRRIEEWLSDKENVAIYGVSLGGAMTFQALRHDTEGKITQVHAFNPPGLYPWDWKEPTLADVNIYLQEDDFVSTMGFFPKGPRVNVFHVIPDVPEKGFKAHARVHTGKENVAILRGDVRYENSRFVRKLLTTIHITLGFLLVFLPMACIFLFYKLGMGLADLPKLLNKHN